MGPRLVLSDPRDVEIVAAALGAGAVVGHAFGNFYVISTRPGAATVRAVNLMKGRPADQVGSITTTPLRIPRVYDWSALPAGLAAHEVLGVMDALFSLGPFGFRGPAAPDVPDHLTQIDAGVRTAQVIAPGYACPSNDFLAAALRAAGTDPLYITSANQSRHLSGAPDSPAHWRAEGLRADFGSQPRFVLLEHDDEEAARARYPRHAPMSTTILAFHRLAGPRTLLVERHGSLPVEAVRDVVAPFGFDVALGPLAVQRLGLRSYQDAPVGALA
jgi:hypothetical protein